MIKRGFTFVELSVVVAIMALMAILVAPNYVNLERARVERAFQPKLLNLIKQAKETAISGAQPTTLKFDSSNNQFTLDQDQASTDQTTMGQTATDQTTSIATVDKPESVQINRFVVADKDVSDGDFQLRFFPDGTSSKGGLEWELRDKPQALNVPGNGRAELVDQLPDPATVRWQAGDLYETRQ